jgi:hypothetical protein
MFFLLRLGRIAVRRRLCLAVRLSHDLWSPLDAGDTVAGLPEHWGIYIARTPVVGGIEPHCDKAWPKEGRTSGLFWLEKQLFEASRTSVVAMKRLPILSAMFFTLVLASIAQDDGEKPTVIPDSAMKPVVERVLRYYFKPRSQPHTIYVFERGVKSDWLPEIRNIKFVLLDAEKAKEHEAVYFFQELRRKGTRFTIQFGYGEPDCTGTGDDWVFIVRNGRVRLWNPGSSWGMGCGGSSGDGRDNA